MHTCLWQADLERYGVQSLVWCSHSRFWQVFVSQLNLVVIVQMRVKYLVSILRDAITQLPDFSLDVGEITQKLILECATAWLDYPAALPTVAERAGLLHLQKRRNCRRMSFLYVIKWQGLMQYNHHLHGLFHGWKHFRFLSCRSFCISFFWPTNNWLIVITFLLILQVHTPHKYDYYYVYNVDKKHVCLYGRFSGGFCETPHQTVTEKESVTVKC